MDMQQKCKVCDKELASQRGLHLHIKKQHKVEIKDYYLEHFSRLSKHYKKKIKFKNANQYLSDQFTNKQELLDWCDNGDEREVKDYLKKILGDRIKEKELKYAPNHLELQIKELPGIDVYKNFFGSYGEICKELEIDLMFNKSLPKKFFEEDVDDSMKIFIDTREQKPLKFKNSEEMKLDFGDYTAAGDYYTYTYIDRKSEGDLKSTLSSGNLDRFKRELERAREFNSYVFVVIESNLEKIKKRNIFASHKVNLPYIWHNMRLISHEYRDVCQFVFAQSRKGSEKIIPKILKYGRRIWDVDLQYFIDKKLIS
jgi:hypothetical protein